jgi:hypothetical protein
MHRIADANKKASGVPAFVVSHDLMRAPIDSIFAA